MLKISIRRASARVTSSALPKFLVGRGWIGPSRIEGIRFNSSGPGKPSISELQTELPPIDNIGEITSSITDQATQTIGEAANHIGYLQSVGLAKSWWWPPDLIQHALETVHVYTGLPWWGTICTVTILVRLIMFPIYVKSSDTIARNSHIKPELDKITAQIMATTELAEGQKYALKRKKLLADNGIKNRWLAAPMLQIPVALGFFSGLREMSNYPVDGFVNQGTGWFLDLSQADPYLGLQVITAAVLISFTRLGGETGAQQFTPTMKKFFTILPLLSIPATMNLSAGVVLYFAVNGTFSVLQTLTLRNKWVRSKLNIADVMIHPQSANMASKGIIESLKENMAKAREQAERRQLMQDREKAIQEETKELRKNSKIKIVRRSDIHKKKQL